MEISGAQPASAACFLLNPPMSKGMILPMRIILATTVASFLLIITGCSRCEGTDWTAGVEKPEVVIPKAEIDLVWDEVLDVLREHYFEPDFQNRRAGIILSHPEVSQQPFEFWRADARGWCQWAESALHTVRRQVEIQFVPADDHYDLDVLVHVQRKSQLERQVTTASGTLTIFRDNVPLYTGQRLKEGDGVHWVDLGRDERLERYLLERIIRRISFEPESLSAVDQTAD